MQKTGRPDQPEGRGGIPPPKQQQPPALAWLWTGLRILATVFFLFVLVALNRCNIPGVPSILPTYTSSPASSPSEPATALPDLAITFVKVELETGGACDFTSTRLGVRVWLKNAGPGDAGPFAVAVNGAQQTVPDGLASGQTISLWFDGYAQSGENIVSVDPDSQIQESNEDNNTISERLPIPTLPPTCTPSSSVPLASYLKPEQNGRGGVPLPS